jgi:ubiquinol oxidase
MDEQREERIDIPKAEDIYLPLRSDTRPGSAFVLATSNFKRELLSIFDQLGSLLSFLKADAKNPPLSLGFVLSNEKVSAAEALREENGGGIEAHPVSRALYNVGCLVLDSLFDERPITRFWFLETIARIPYFSYISVLHLYESLGWWRACELRKIHSAEDWNELHHLLIMVFFLN